MLTNHYLLPYKDRKKTMSEFERNLLNQDENYRLNLERPMATNQIKLTPNEFPYINITITSIYDEICDKMAVLHGGNTKFIGTPKEFREKYQADNAESAFLKCISNQ